MINSLSQLPLAKISLRFLVAWLLISVFFFVNGEWIIRFLLPFLSLMTNFIAHNYHAELTVEASDLGQIIAIKATAIEDVYRLGIPIAPAGTRVNASGTLMHLLVPIVIVFTIVSAWPVGLKKYIAQIICAFPVALLILALTTPMLLASHIEQVFHTAAQNYAGKELPMPFLMMWVVFMEIGGVWLLPLLGAFLCIKIGSLIELNSKAENAIPA